MPWARFDERFPKHRRIRGLSDAAFRLQVSAVCWSSEYLTNGHIPPGDLSDSAEMKRPEKAATELAQVGRWHLPGHDCDSEFCYPIADGWLIHNYLEFNPSRESVETKREADAQRKKAGRTSESRRSPRGHTSESEVTHPVPSRPVPVVTNVTTNRPVPSAEILPASAGTTQTLIAEWLDHSRAKPPTRIVGQVAKIIGELLTEGQSYDVVRRGLAEWDGKDLHPSVLHSVVYGVAKGPAVRPNKATQRTAENLSLVARLEAQERGA
jgi:hypothetical protein